MSDASANGSPQSAGPRVDFHTHLAPFQHEAVKGPANLHRPDLLLEYLRERALDRAVVSVPPPFFRQDLGAEEAVGWVRSLNDGLARVAAESDELLPLAYLPLEHPELAIAEARRLREERGWVGYCASAGGRSVSLADEALAPLWRALDRDAALLLLHPGTSPDERLEEFYLHNLLGNPVETAIAAAQLVFGDVLPTHPRMRVLLVHCGGCVPDLVPRWDHGVATDRPGLEPLTEPPSEAVRRFFVDCLVHDPGAVDRAIDVFGEDKLVLGSDWPFPMGTNDPASLIAHRGEAFVGRAAVANAREALGRD
ncbi:MAG: amidohydrolase [Actinobacteria bacterium]|nr:amidohydrolase [Actinomycetota bacterium]